MNLSGIRDVNELKRLLAAGQISQDDLNNTQLSGSFGPSDQLPPPQSAPVNALQGIVNPQDQQDPSQAPQMPAQTAQQQPLQGSNYVRNEQTGHITYLTPQGLSDTPSMGAVIQAPQGPQAPQTPSMMQVSGYVGQNRVNMGPQQAPGQVNVDYGQPPMELMGGMKAYYSKDEPGVAYVMKDGRPVQKVMLQDQSAQLAYNKEAEAAQLQQAQVAQSQASTAHTVEETRASRVNNPDWLGLDSGGASNGAGGAPGSPAGIDLSKVPPGILQQATAMANGDMALPMTRNGKLNPIAALAFQINPNLKQTDYVQKQATVKDFAPNGIDGQKVKQVNQALHHAGLLLDTIGDLNNFDVAPGIINPIKNTLGPMLSGADVAPGVYKQTADALSLEVRKVYAGAGGGTEGELRDWQASFNPNAGPTQQRAYLKRGMDLLRGGIQALQSSYSRGMGPSANFGNLLDDNARAGLAKITQAGLDPGIGDIVGQQPPQASAPQASAPQPTQDVGSDPRVVVAPDGSRHRFPTTQAALSFRKAIGQ